jgi:3'-phosphoadenosine 5'-phosphosulfate sulfotransferase (PAPS reductase)/FAD synthetase
MYDDVPALFVNTGLEYPEVQKFAMSQKNVVTVRPEMRFDEVLRKYGYPVISKEISERIYYANKGANWAVQCMKGVNPDGSESDFKQSSKKYAFLVDSPIPVSHMCCFVMKKNPAKRYEKQTGRKPILGTMAGESRLRKSQWMKTGCNTFESKRPRSAPLSFWTEQDILHYIKKYSVPYCPVYGDIVIDDTGRADMIDGQINVLDYLGDYEPDDRLKTTGRDRTGCIFCMFGCHLEKDPNRFQRLKETHPRQYEYCIGGGEMVDGKWQPSKEGLGLGKVLDYIGVKYD